MRSIKNSRFLALSLVNALAFFGCGKNSTPSQTAKAPPAASAAPHIHEHKPPHGGTLVELGEDFAHIELVLDSAQGRLSAFALDGEAENSVRLGQSEMELVLDGAAVKLRAVANPLTGEKIGETSEFQSDAGAFKGKDHFSGLIKKVEIKGQVFELVPVQFPQGIDSRP